MYRFFQEVCHKCWDPEPDRRIKIEEIRGALLDAEISDNRPTEERTPINVEWVVNDTNPSRKALSISIGYFDLAENTAVKSYRIPNPLQRSFEFKKMLIGTP